MKLSLRPKVTADYSPHAMMRIAEDIERQLTALSEGRLTATYNAYTSAPATGTWAVGDFIRNSAPSELGSASSKYVILGWVCTVAGTPGTWLQCRVLTGN